MRLSLFNCVRFGPQLKELRIHLSQTDAASKGVRYIKLNLFLELQSIITQSQISNVFFVVVLCCRDFIASGYVGLKKENPKLPILIRECEGVQPRVWARYGNYL